MSLSKNMATVIEAIEDHLHRRNRTFGKSSDQSGNNWATEDRLVPFQAISGNGVYGADADDEAKVFGTDDTPLITGENKFDPGMILLEDVSVDTTYILRLIWGSGTMADAITAGQYSTIPVMFDSTNPQLSAGIPFLIGIPQITVGMKLWIQAKNATDNATADFYLVAHGY